MLEILPNPANDLLSINLKNGETNGKAEIFDVQGQLVQQCDLLQSETKVSVANIASGIYFVRVTTSEATYQSKLQIIH